MKKLIHLTAWVWLCSPLLFCACSKHHLPSGTGSAYVISGTIVNIDTGKLYLYHSDTTGKIAYSVLDSTDVVHGGFMFTGRLIRPDACKIKIENMPGCWPYSPWFILDSGQTRAVLYKDSMPSSTFSGGALQQQLSQFNQKMFAVDNFYSHALVRCKDEDSLTQLSGALTNARGEVILEQVQAFPASYTSEFVTRQSRTGQLSIDLQDSIRRSLADQRSYYARNLLRSVETKKARSESTSSVNGVKAPSFSLRDLDGKVLKNKTFKGKYLLLDFWASWCKPCLDEFPNVKAMYEKYHAEGLEIVSVSMDHSIEKCREALGEFNPSWPQVCDLKAFDAPLLKKYIVDFIPYNFLIGPDGKIIDQNLMGEKLDEALSKVF